MLKKNVFNNVKYVKFKGTMTKWPVQKPTQNDTKHIEHQDATDI